MVTVENAWFKILIPGDFESNPRFVVRHKSGTTDRDVKPRLQIACLAENPNLLPASTDWHNGIAGWTGTDKNGS